MNLKVNPVNQTSIALEGKFSNKMVCWRFGKTQTLSAIKQSVRDSNESTSMKLSYKLNLQTLHTFELSYSEQDAPETKAKHLSRVND